MHSAKYIICSLFLLLHIALKCQHGAAFFNDENGIFYFYSRGNVSLIQRNPVTKTFLGGDYGLYYSDNFLTKLVKDNYQYTLCIGRPDILLTSNHLLAYKLGGTIQVMDDKKLFTIERFSDVSPLLHDSVLVYIDFFKRIQVYYHDSIYDLGLYEDQEIKIAENIVAFPYEFANFNVFYHGSLQSIENWLPKDYKIAKDIIAYNDYMSRFKAYIQGKVYEVEDFEILDYQVIDGAVIYTNRRNELVLYDGQEKHVLLNTKPKMLLARYNYVLFSDLASRLFLWHDGKLEQIEWFTPERIEISRDMVVYQNQHLELVGFHKSEKQKFFDFVPLGWSLQNRALLAYELNRNTWSIWDNRHTFVQHEILKPLKDKK
jgi:hypothetical protein